MVYPPSAGRSADEILRVVDSLRRTDRAKEARPVRWQPGERGTIPPSIPDEQAGTLSLQGREAEASLRSVEAG